MANRPLNTLNNDSRPSSSVIDVATMSSREIATLTGKAHKNVIRDIEAMISEIEKDGSDLSHQAKSTGYVRHKDARGYTSSIDLDQSHTYTLMSGYDARQRKKLVDRWMELEAKEAAPQHRIPQTLSEALMLAAQKVAELEATKAELAVVTPKAEALDRISTSDGSFGLQEAAKILQVGPRAFVQWLRTNRWIYKRPGSTNNLGYQDRINAGYLWHKVTTYDDANGEKKTRDDVKILPKGIARLAREVPGASLDPDLSPDPVAPRPLAPAPEPAL